MPFGEALADEGEGVRGERTGTLAGWATAKKPLDASCDGCALEPFGLVGGLQQGAERELLVVDVDRIDHHGTAHCVGAVARRLRERLRLGSAPRQAEGEQGEACSRSFHSV